MSIISGLNRDSCYFVSGLANYISLESLSLLVPLLADSGSGVHAVFLELLLLGLESHGSSVLGNFAVCYVHLVLCNIDSAGNDLAVSVENDCCYGCVNLCVACCRRSGRGYNAHTELVSCCVVRAALAVCAGTALAVCAGNALAAVAVGAACKAYYHGGRHHRCKNLLHNSSS